MLRQTPPLEAIEAFLLAARAESFRQAAASLALSPSALSRRVQQLESFVGAPLFDRTGARPHLTESGRRYLDEVAPALENIRRATSDLRRGGGPVRLTASHSLAVGWLMPRLQALREAGVELDLRIEQGVAGLRAGQADVAICGGDEQPADFPSEVLIDLEAVIVSAPVAARDAGGGLSDLASHELLRTRSSPQLWSRWLSAVGRANLQALGAPYPTLHSMYEAAANGLGLALAIPLVADRFLAEGRLQPRLPLRARVGEQYRLVFASRRTQQRPAIEQIARWLRAEAAASSERFVAWATQTD